MNETRPEQEKPKDNETEQNKTKLDITSLEFKFFSGVIIALIPTLAANSLFKSQCRFIDYQGNLFIIFIAIWFSWMGLASQFGSKGKSPTVIGIIPSLVIIFLEAFFCIIFTGFWIAPVCD